MMVDEFNFKNCWLNPKKKIYYYNASLICGTCLDIISNKFILNMKWSRKKKASAHIYCLKCIPKIKPLEEAEENFLFNCVKELPLIAQIWIPVPPTLVCSSGLSTFEAVNVKSEAQIIDRTKYSGRPNSTFSISNKENKKRFLINECNSEETKQKTTSQINELDYGKTNVGVFFENLKNSVPVIENEEIKQIENEIKIIP